jgi:hypothetical protein
MIQGTRPKDQDSDRPQRPMNGCATFHGGMSSSPSRDRSNDEGSCGWYRDEGAGAVRGGVRPHRAGLGRY